MAAFVRAWLVLVLLPFTMAAASPQGGPKADPEHSSATWLGSQAQQLEHALTKGEASLRLRSFFIDQDLDQGPLQRTLALGGWFSFRSAPFHGLRAGFSLATAQPFIYDDPDEGGAGVLPGDQNGIVVLSQAYLEASLGKTRLSLFRQALNTPFLDQEDDRLIPTTYEAYGLRNTSLPHTKLELFYVNGVKLQDSDTFQSMTSAAGLSSDEGLVLLGGRYSPGDGRFMDVYNYYCMQYLNTFYWETDYAMSLPHGFTLTPALQFIDQRSVGDALGGSFSTHAFGAKAELDWRGFGLVLAYTQVSDDHDMQQPWADYPGFTGMVELNNFLAGMDAAMLGLGWQGQDPRWGSLNAWAYYSLARAPDQAGCSSPSQNEFNLILTYQLKLVPELGLTFKYADVHQDQVLGDTSMQEVHLLLEWSLHLW